MFRTPAWRAVGSVWYGTLLGAVLLGCEQAPAPKSEALPESLLISAEGATRHAAPAQPELAHGPSDAWFETITPEAGVAFSYRNGEEAGRYALLETLGGGAAILDFDGDGDADLFVTGGGTIPQSEGEIYGLPPALFENLGDFQFRSIGEISRLTECRHYSHGCAVTDFDRDGFPDIAVAGFGGLMLYRNLGDGTFREIAEEVGLTASGWCTALAWSDVDLDGFNDLFVVRYVDWNMEKHIVCTTPQGEKVACSPTAWRPTTSFLFRNIGDGTFADESIRRGITGRGNGLGVVAADLNGDGRCEFYVANDETDNLLYVAQSDGNFQEIAQLAGVATDEFGNDEGSMGIAVADYDGDGRPDIFVTNFEREDNSLYGNLGGGMFLHASQQAGLVGPSRRYVGFGPSLTDFDGDGWPDIFLVNGHVFSSGGQAGYRQPPQLFQNLHGKRFEEISTAGGEYFTRRHAGRGVAVGDLNDDGAPDVVAVHQNDPVEILRNRRLPDRWIRLRLRGTTSNAEAIGAAVQLRDGDLKRAQWVSSGNGYFSQQDSRLLFALTTRAEVVDVQVRWPSGRAEEFLSLPISRTHELIEGRGTELAEHP